MINSEHLLRNLIASVAATAAALVMLPASASADVSCELANPGGLLDVTLTGDNDSVSVGPNSIGNILVREQGPIVACAGPAATTANTNLIRVRDLTASGSANLSIHGNPILGGDAEADGANEIELWLELGAGASDNVTFYPVAGTNSFRLGDDGINTNVGSGGPDREVAVMTGIEQLTMFGGDGDDSLGAQGGEGTGDPFADQAFLFLGGDGGNDQLTGGDYIDGDWLQGGPGNDTLSGAAGNDFLTPGEDDDTLTGGPGLDTADFQIPITGPVNVDLATSGPQNTGQGTDTVDAESAIGTAGADTLRGTAGANVLNGYSGDDTIDGRGGDDELEGSAGADLVTYADAPAGVAVDLAAQTATGGFGVDAVRNFESVTGSGFADSLVGNAEANTITGLAGADQVSAVGGADTVDVRDGEADIASCGAEIDSATADQASLDSVSPDCENAAFLPEAGGNGGGEGGGGGAADGELDFALTAKSPQKPAKRGRATVKALCPTEACTVRATASLLRPGGGKPRALKLRAANAELAAGEPAKLALRVKKGQAPLLRDTIATAKRLPKLRVAATATDAAGNTATETLKIALAG